MTASESSRNARALTAALLLLLACSSQPGRDAAVDSAFEAGRRDASSDVGDVAGDSATDTSPDTAVPDAGPAEWLRVAGLPDNCDVRIALDPAAAVPALRFESCPNYPTGCRQVVVDWPERDDVQHRFRALGRKGYHDGTTGFFFYSRPAPRTNRVYFVVADDRGMTRVALEGDDAVGARCYLGQLDGGEGRFLLGIVRNLPDGTLEQYFGGGSITAPAETFAIRQRLTTAELTAKFVQDVAVGARHFALGTAPAHEVYRVTWDGERSLVGSFRFEANEAYLQEIVGDAIFYDSFGVDHHTNVSLGGAEGVPLIDPANAEATSFHTDGRDMVWMQGFGRQTELRFDRIELWTSPFATRSEDLRPRSVAVLSLRAIHDGVDVGFGRAVVDETADLMAVYDLASGARSELRAPAGVGFFGGAMLYMGPEEIAVGIGTRGMQSGSTTVQFIRYDALR